MAEYVITTENAADLPESFVKENEIGVLSLYYTIDGVTYGPGHEPQMSAEDFYAKMRAGMMPKTQQVNLDQAMETFRSYLKQGKDILHLALTSAVSGSCNSAMMAARELKGRISRAHHHRHRHPSLVLLRRVMLVERAVRMKKCRKDTRAGSTVDSGCSSAHLPVCNRR